MKSSIFVLSALLPVLSSCSCGDTARSVASTLTEKTVETAKGAAAGVTSGIEEGRKGTVGLDGAQVLTSWSDMKGKASVEILSVKGDETGTVEVTLGVSNSTDQPIRLTGLTGQSVMLLDKDGYISRLERGPLELTVPQHAKDKAALVFKGKAADFVTLRLLGGELAMPR